jgi:flagellar FliL protein
MSDEIISTKKKGGKGKMIIILLVVLLMGGAGIAGGLYAAGAFGSDSEAATPTEDPNRPQLVKKGEEVKAAGGEGGEKGEAPAPEHGGKPFKLPKGGVDLPRPKDPSLYQATYFQMPAPYTSNLADTDSLVQIALAVSTYYDARVLNAVKTHEMAIRSAILLMLSQQEELALSTPQGKEALQKKLTKIVNSVLREKTGYSGIDNVYFTNFVIQ